MTDRYTKARTVTRTAICREMGWQASTGKKRLRTLAWLTAPFRVGRFQYNADVIGALQMLYGQVPVSTREDRDFLTRFLKDKEIP